MRARAVSDLPEPLSPAIARISPSATSKDMPVDDGAHAVLAADLDREVLHGEERRRAHAKTARGM